MVGQSSSAIAIRGRQGGLRPWLGTLLVALSLMLALRPGAAALRSDVSVSTSGGYARLVFGFPDDPEPEAHLANGILIISFKKPVDVAVDRIALSAPEYVGAARLDPDGTAVRLALNRKVTVNTMAVGERFYVDLLPEDWTGLPPGVPREVIEDLSRRARDAERKAREQAQLVRQRDVRSVRVRVGTQPTFTRYVFELPDLVAIATDRSHDKLALRFEAPLKFDLGDALALLPPTVAGIEANSHDDAATVRFSLIGLTDVRTFREDNNFIVDIVPLSASEARRDSLAEISKPSALPPISAPPVPQPREPAAPTGRSPVPSPASGVAPPARSRNGEPPAASSGPGEADGKVPAATPTTGVTAGARQGPTPPAAPSSPSSPSSSSAPSAPAAAAQSGARPRVSAEPVLPAAGPAGSPTNAQRLSSPGGEDAQAGTPQRDPGPRVEVEVRRQGDGLRLVFPFTAPTAAAVFGRADTVWLVFDSVVPIDITKLVAQPIGVVRTAAVTRSPTGQVVRLKLDRPKLTSMEASGTSWAVTIGDMVLEPTSPLSVGRSIISGGRPAAVIALEGPQRVEHLSDPEIGDTLIVVTAFGPTRGFLKTQEFVEFRVLASTHGVVIQPLADDVNVTTLSDRIVIARPAPGLTLSAGSGMASSVAEGGQRGYRPFDPQIWGFDSQSKFASRQDELIRAVAEAPDRRRMAARLDIARFYLAQNLFGEAKGALDVAVADGHQDAEIPAALVMRAVAEIMLGHAGSALKGLGNPVVHDDYDAPLWRAMALAAQGKWVEAREGFKTIESASATIPVELRRAALRDAARTAIEVGDFADAANKLHELEMLSVPADFEPTLNLLKGRIAEALARPLDALAAYEDAARADDAPVAAQARLRQIEMQLALGKLSRTDAIAALELRAVLWRGDDTEVETLQQLGRLYTQEARYRDALQSMLTALRLNPRSPLAPRIQEEAAATFQALFLDGKADAMPPIKALSLFYDFRELTPAGRRGDEMVRRLAERLVSVDLLNQAAELLQYQVDHRLEGAARAQVAVRLAMIYLMARKPERALQALRETRSGDLPNQLRTQRLLLEARALSDTGQHDLALELVVNLEGSDVERLRADVLWTAHRWQQAGEQIEREYGARWRDFAPLTDAERADILRGAIAYALADDAIGLDRFREKYAAKMSDGPDRRAFEVVTTPLRAASAEFDGIAKQAVATSTLDAFLRELRARDPEAPLDTPPPPAVPQPQSGVQRPREAS
jgi:tetratricopeptide (TPR) repeat protein